ncbi:hypothetical protein [Williamsia sp. 1135]|uniref:hypothetical protein n=1 Tax=Williamsia sp. 1135 TaxID=1889262 RepID=UPI00117FEE20|nr:hypothetical protein [Williamsia sp. 1135]
MSAYLVDPEHIHVLVRAGLPGRLGMISWPTDDDAIPTPSNGLIDVGQSRVRALRPESASAVGQLLLDANAASVITRYREDETYIYDYQRPGRVFEPIEILKAIDGYDYQSCEAPDWATSEAFHYWYHLRITQIRRIAGYSDADTWEITPTTGTLVDQRRKEARARRTQ